MSEAQFWCFNSLLSLQIYTQGCIQKVQAFVEQNLYVVAGIALGVALMQLLGERLKTKKIHHST